MLANETGDHRAFAVQVPWTQYFTPRYCSPKRLASYGHQLQEVSRLKPESVLEIGIGNGIVAGLMKSCGYAVTTLDHDASLGPDVVASVTSVPLEDDVVDVVLCCEVLEHLPYEQVSMALSEIRRVSSKFAVLSVPDRGRYCRVDVKLPFLKSLRVCMECPPWNAPVLRPGSEHYWEIGRRGYPRKKVLRAIEDVGWQIIRTHRIWELPYQRMIVLEKRVKADDVLSVEEMKSF